MKINFSEGLNIATASYLFFVFMNIHCNYFPTSLSVESYELKHKIFESLVFLEKGKISLQP